MTDRGTAYAVQTAEQTPVGVFAHVMEPTAAFPGSLTAYDADEQVIELAAYGHPFDGPSGASDFTDQFTVDRSGTGFYMQPADDTQDALQGLANGRSQVTGAMTIDMQLVETLSGSSTVVGAPGLTFDFMAAPMTGSSVASTPTLARLFWLEETLVGESFLSSPLLGKLGTYREAVLASAPLVFMHLEETSGLNALNDSSLGGGVIGTISGTVPARSTSSLVQTAPGGMLRMGTDPASTNGTALLATTQAAAPATLEWSAEFWYRSAANFIPLSIFAARHLTNAFYSISIQSGGQVRAQRSGTDAAFNGPGGILIQGSKNVHVDKQPHHIAVTYSPFEGNGVLRIYVDGQLDVEGEAPTPRATDDFSPTWTETPYWLKGSGNYPWELDEPTYYNRAITATEVATHFQAAYFATKLAGTSAGTSALIADLIYAGAEEHLLEGVAAGLSTTYGDLVSGNALALAGALAGTSEVAPPLMLKYGQLNATQTAVFGGPKKHAVFSRAKI